VALDGPYELVFRPGWEGLGTRRECYREQPNSIEQDRLDRVAGRVLGHGCVVCDYFDPHQHETADDPTAEEWVRTFHQKHRGRAGLRLVPASGPGESTGGWIVNQPLTYRECAGCTRKVPDLSWHRVPYKWSPRHPYTSRNGRRGLYPTEPGPHPAGSLACHECDPRTSDHTQEHRWPGPMST
jgi:hypothetical protein